MNSTLKYQVFCALFLFFIISANAQSFVKQNEIEVIQDESLIKFPFVGGLNNGQFWEADINFDGIMDLVIYDKKESKVLTFINNGTANQVDYEYNPNFESAFPIEDGFYILKDLNCDAVVDLFTVVDGSKVKILLGSNVAGNLEFNLHIDTLKFFDPLDINLPNKFLSINKEDLPSLDDLNGDGDMDILTFNIAGGKVEYFENQSIENGNGCGTLEFELVDDCWGNFYESGLVSFVELNNCFDSLVINDDYFHSKTQNDALHPGSTLLTFDANNDGLKELILGDISYNNLVFLTNGGTNDDALMVNQDPTFPQNDVPVFIKSYPAAYLLDIDNDAKREMIVTPNGTNKSENLNCVWLYENTNTEEEPIFEYSRNNFLVNDMIDVGDAAKPVFFDYNFDGLKDLIVANNGYFEAGNQDLKSTLTLYKNVGSLDTPVFELANRDYLNLHQDYNFFEIHPAFGDLNGDGKEDLLIGTSIGQTHYFENISTSNDSEAQFQLGTGYNLLDPGNNSFPFIFDINADGLNDIVCGERNGNINFYKNIGTTSNPIFEWVNDINGTTLIWGVDVREETNGVTSITGYSVPQVGYFFDANKLSLIVSSESGKIYHYTDIEQNVNGGNFTLVTDNLLPRFEGRRISAFLEDIDNDGKVDLFAGTFRGGIVHYEYDQIVANEEFTKQIYFDVFPNPSSGVFYLNVEYLEWIQIFNANGKLLLTQKNSTIDLSNYSNGIYFLKASSNNSIIHSKIIKQ